jgi:hypothetical protein
MEDAFAVSRMREIRLSGSMWRGPETERWTSLNGHEAGNGGYSQGPPCTPPRRPSTRPLSNHGVFGHEAEGSWHTGLSARDVRCCLVRGPAGQSRD